MDRKVTLLDGAMGTELRARGVEVPDHTTSIWSAKALRNDPQTIVDIHRAYIDAGADVITINNYAVTPPLLRRDGWEEDFAPLTEIAMDLACRAREESGADVRIAGSLPPLETSYRADLVGTDAEILDTYREMAKLLAPRVDVLLCETLASGREAVAAATAATETGCETWLSFTLQGRRIGTLPSGESVSQAFEATAQLPVAAFMVNCCAANFVTGGIADLHALTEGPIGGYANAVNFIGADAGPDRGKQDWTRLDADDYAAFVMHWLEAGASIVGGCCSTRPAHIARLHAALGRSS